LWEDYWVFFFIYFYIFGRKSLFCMNYTFTIMILWYQDFFIFYLNLNLFYRISGALLRNACRRAHARARCAHFLLNTCKVEKFTKIPYYGREKWKRTIKRPVSTNRFFTCPFSPLSPCPWSLIHDPLSPITNSDGDGKLYWWQKILMGTEKQDIQTDGLTN
jgi:hypothetical protein